MQFRVLFFVLTYCFSAIQGTPLPGAEPPAPLLDAIEVPPPQITESELATLAESGVLTHTNRNGGATGDPRGCGQECPLGYKVVAGVITCECKHEGTYEGDMRVSNETYHEFLRMFGMDCEEHRTRGASLSNAWPKTGSYVYVPYTIKTGFTTEQQTKIQEAINDFATRTCIRFVARTAEVAHVEFTPGSGCSSFLGKTGRKQAITLAGGCFRPGTVRHEMMHALGFYHEHSRADRDNHVEIKWDNIASTYEGNFRKIAVSNWNSYGSPYDINSTMHYGAYAFATDRSRPTIVAKAAIPAGITMGQRLGFSPQDLFQINAKYGCSGYTTSTGSTTSTAPTTTTTTVPTTAACIDKNTNCPTWKTQGFCTDSRYVSYMQSFCYRSCSSCAGTTTTTTTTAPTTTTTTTTPAPTTTTTTTTAGSTSTTAGCSDNHRYCAAWARQNFCTTGAYINYMRNTCPMSCNICTTGTTTVAACTDKAGSCNAWKQAGYCTGRYATYMATNCKSSCGLCANAVTTTTTAAPCVDKSTHCAAWAAQQYCVKDFVNYMRANCRVTCGLCGGHTTTQVATTTVASTGLGTYNGQCGIPMVSLQFRTPSQRIIGGTNANYGSHPWLVNIRRLTDVNICGGTLIAPNKVLTAAHCFGNNRNPNVNYYFGFLGKQDRRINRVDRGQRRVSFASILIHPNYNHATTDNDIAIITLTESVTYNNYVRPACLPQQDETLAARTSGVVAGWGDVSDAASNLGSDILQQATVEVIDNTVCNQWLKIFTNRDDEVTSNMMCAGYESGGRDACQGDSGGPLIIKVSNRLYVYGIVSWGYDCGKVRKPGVYTKVSNYVTWINSNL
nr:plasminogen [Ciona intestinalis]|eukprot:XP_002131103.1 plasminogen [Ciona intestinalis]